MPTCIHLYSEDSDRSVFYHVYREDIIVKTDDIFNFSYSFYSSLPENYKKTFDKFKLKIGKYTVTSTYTEENEFDGKIRYIFLKPIKEIEENGDEDIAE